MNSRSLIERERSSPLPKRSQKIQDGVLSHDPTFTAQPVLRVAAFLLIRPW